MSKDNNLKGVHAIQLELPLELKKDENLHTFFSDNIVDFVSIQKMKSKESFFSSLDINQMIEDDDLRVEKIKKILKRASTLDW